MRLLALCMLWPLCAAPALAAETKPLDRPYKDDPKIVKLLEGLGDGCSMRLPKAKVIGVGIDQDKHFAARGPRGRDYGNKMAYAPDRETAMYAGANHGAPSRLNDCWEFHLGSNTWVRLAIGDGGDHGRVRRARDAIRKGKNVEKQKAFVTKWYTDHVVVKDGYVQTKRNGGPVSPWHTWDGLAYDAASKRLLWAVLDTDKIMLARVRAYAKWTGQDFEKLRKQIKPGTGLYLFDPRRARWFRQLGDGPRPYLRGMGGSLVYVPEWKKTVWYCAAQNVTPNDFAMWTYDGVANKWERLAPNGGKSIRALVHGDKVAPSSEVQMAYSPRHRKIVAVLKQTTYVYDLVKNAWSKACEDKRNYAHDAVTVFDYDSANDVFLLVNSPEGHWGKKRELRAFRIDTKQWTTLKINGPGIDRRPYRRHTGYYDPRFNVLVVSDDDLRLWAYRLGKGLQAK